MSPSTREPETAHDLAYFEAVPYLLVMESVERQGEWLRRAEYPELPGCAAEAPSAVEALEKLEHERYRVLAAALGSRGLDTSSAAAAARSPAFALSSGSLAVT
jgi:hypothetical protein